MAKNHCGNCNDRLGGIACSNKYGGSYCSAKCADIVEAEMTAGLQRIDDYIIDNTLSINDTPNMVESPPHYTNARFETIEVIEEITAGYSDGFVAYSVGNALKYLARAPFKHDDGGLEDLKKAERYVRFAIERIERNGV